MPTPLNVHDGNGKAVPAKYLEINGRVILDPSGSPYIVPADFDWNRYMEKFERLKDSVEAREKAERPLPDDGTRAMRDTAQVYSFLYAQFHAALPGSSSDIQRRYNGHIAKGPGEIVPAFTPAASFLYGAACRAVGLSEWESLTGGGAQNILSWGRTRGPWGNVDISGQYFNNPHNASHIESGWNAYARGIGTSGGSSKKAKKPADQPGRLTPTPANRTPIGPTSPRSSLETPQPSNPLSYPNVGTMGPGEQKEFLSPDTSQAYPTSFADPLAHYAKDGFSPVPQNAYAPGLDPSVRPNLLDSPSSFDFFSSESGAQPQVSPQPSGQTRGMSDVPAGQARKAPFYSLKDRLDFLGRVYRVAKPISDATGLSLPFILAHTAHEVDFGKKIEGNNLFNLKADRKWRGPTHARADVTYRSYLSYEESMKDYLAYLQANPRFGKMFEPVTRASLGRLADAIHYAGYSDDPLYGPRILAAAKKPIMKQALWQYEHWPPGEGR